MSQNPIAMMLPAGVTPAVVRGVRDPDEIVHGAREIGEVLGLTKTQTDYHLRRGHIKGVTKLGRLHIGIVKNILMTASPGA
jgi:hypothetical protein